MKVSEKTVKIHILGIAGTFMGGIAQLAKAMGVQVSGSDKAIYPPMSTQLEQAGIAVSLDDDIAFLKNTPNVIVIGNAKSRGDLAVEATLNTLQPYTSGPQWLAENVLHDRWVIAVAGTHGKTTTASMVAWILEFAGLEPGFLIGGVPSNFGVSARLGQSPFFVVEADEYDTAFFDKRSKFVHYHPRTLVINNLEFDHADIFENLAAIQTQFHHCVRTVPGNGLIIAPDDESNVDEVLEKGCWTPVETQGGQNADWSYELIQPDGSVFKVLYQGKQIGEVRWAMTGLHNIRNALSALAAAHYAGVMLTCAVEALSQFNGVARRMSLVGTVMTKEGGGEIIIYDDFAHHPTAITTTLQGAKKQLNKSLNKQGNSRKKRLIAVFEPRSNTMRMGIHQETLPAAFQEADAVYAFIDPVWNWKLDDCAFNQPVIIASSYNQLLEQLCTDLQAGDTVVIMSNGSFGGIHQKLLQQLTAQQRLTL
ncbi:UDP-N-acetylmuramate:L-alanyl-gamma-D-glutamyl-meso-diaminopimelate ligase [hydrothermal vent metagenome]|uniref:UDP-N-acetylmuramate:L-alanyl-gamma-D-glutamyl-meso-diaminopimelate ligase n=1 Tax=hydrothermal vent metagenome TaxID=652676 RepID=A0A3B0W1L7_9ZZZZ